MSLILITKSYAQPSGIIRGSWSDDLMRGDRIIIGASSGSIKYEVKEDTLCFPVSKVQKLLIAAQQKVILEDEVKTLNERITEKGRQLASSNTRDSISIAALKSEILILKDQKGIALGEMAALNKQLRKERRKTRLVAFAGAITTVAGILLIK